MSINIMKRKLTTFLIVLLSFVFLGALSEKSEFSLDKAKKVEMVLKHIAKKKRKSPYLRKISFTQEEINSYLNIFYAKKYAPEVKYIKLKLERKNHVSGEMEIKLVGKKYDNVPSFLRDIEVETSGKVECENYRMRFIFDKLKINGTNFSPEFLDEAFGAAQVGSKVKKSMFDWFDLLPGLKKVIIDHRKITIFY